MAEKEIYYIKDNIVFSNSKLLISYPMINDIEIDKNSNNIDIIKKLNEIISNKKDVNLNGICNDIENLKSKISENKSNLKKTKEDDYLFIGKTSSLIILDQILKEEENSQSLNDLKKKIENHINKQKPIEKEKLGAIDKEIKSNIKEIEKISNKIERINSKFMAEDKEKISFKKNENVSFSFKIKDYENLIEELEKNLNKKENLESINKNNKLKDKLEDLEYDIKFLEEKIKILIKKKKLGSKKIIKPISFILTLGLIYWTELSDINYNIGKMHLKIANKKEKILKIEKKLNRSEREINRKTEEFKQNQINLTKQITKTKEEIEKLEKGIKTNEKEIIKLESKIGPYRKEIINYSNEIEKLNEAREKLEDVKNDLLEKSSNKISELLNKLIEIRNEDIKKIKEIKEKISNQKIDINGSFTIEF